MEEKDWSLPILNIGEAEDYRFYGIKRNLIG